MEKWIKICDTHYEINEYGVIRNTNTKKDLKPHLDSRKRYFMVILTLKIDGVLCQKSKLVHRLVCQAFKENNYNKPCVNHIDGNKQNNHYSNLEWCTYSENNIHAIKTGLVNVYKNKYYKNKFGEDHNRSIKIECNGIIYGSMSEACRIHNMHSSTISKAIKLNRTAKGFNFKLVN